MEAAAQSNQEPRVLAGKYRLEAQIRSGAMGAIYRAHHLSLDKTVCIKIMHPQLAKDEQFAMRFHREARAASRFDHPNSILVLDYGADDDGTLFIAMELVTGRDLFEIIDEATALPGGISAVMPPRRIVDLLSQTLAALAAAHDVGILHRDLKPENIMVASSWDDGERVKVCDFGIARIDEAKDSLAQSGRRLTRQGFILGTPEYMSPEQARAEAVDARSDVYSAGVILYHVLTGHVPFEDESPIAVALRQINEAPKRPSELNPNVNPQLEAVCLKAISKDPAGRYASAREMRAALRDAVSLPHSTPLPLMTPQPEPIEPPAERLSSLPAVQVQMEEPRPRSKGAFAVVTTLLIAAALGATWKLGHDPSVIATANAAPSPAPAEVAAVLNTAPVAVAPVMAAPVPVPVIAEVVEKRAAATKPVTIAPRKVVETAPPLPVVEDPVIVLPPPPPEPEPEPAPVVATPEPAPVPVVVAVPAYSLGTAHIDLGAAQTVGTTSASVDRALAPIKSRLDVCYRAALPHASTPEGTAVLHVATDDVGIIRQATVTGHLSAETGACVSKAVIGRKIANVDTGDATADVPLIYRPR